VIRLEDVELRRGAKILLSHASCAIAPGEKVGLIGANGAGKSSLFALLRGEISCDAGELSIPPQWRIGYVAQHDHAINQSALEQVLDGDDVLRAIEKRLGEIEHATDHDLGVELGELHQRYEEAGGYTARSRAESLLLGLGFKLDEITRPVSEFSGGWRMRVALARALMNPSDVLLLDEPTNHLDLDAIVWLEQWLRRYAGLLIVISHDREFLDAICKSILAISATTLTRYGGNYTSFEMQRAEQRRQSHFAWEKQQVEIAHLQHFIDRFKAKASKAKQAQSRVKALERMEVLAPAHIDSPFSFRFFAADRAPDPMLRFTQVVCGYQGPEGDVPILHQVTCELRVGERLGLLGANGQGKSTLIKTFAGVLPPLSGQIDRPGTLQVGYFAQHQIESLRPDDTPLEHLARIAPGTREQVLRDYLGRFAFGAAAATSRIAPFSGGEKARLALALLIYQRPNLLLLDEPTNHLDLETREALIRALAEYEGTMVLVSHDRALLRATTDRFWLVADGAIAPFEGDLDDYREWLLNRGKPREAPAEKTTATPPLPPKQASQPVSRRDAAATRAILASRRKPLETRLRRIEGQLAKLTAERDALKEQLADPSLYESKDTLALQQMMTDEAYLAKEIDVLEEDWLLQQAALEQIGATS
jgi:ATP-binding cassette, subfamily F, member 3